MAGAIERFEQEFAHWLGVPGAVAAGFGRAALVFALEAVEVRGAEVLVPDFVCAQVPEGVRRAGGRPVFYSVRRDLSVSPEAFRDAFSPETRAAIVVHYFGRVLPEVAALAAICRERGVTLVEDCALALGARSGERQAGTFGDVAVFSFTKSDWCYGGGVATSASPELLERLREFRARNARTARRLCFLYGVLRRLDVAANRPRWSRIAGHAGIAFERLCGLRTGNFYDAGRFDAPMTGLAARRASRVLAGLRAATEQRRRSLAALVASLRGAVRFLARPEPSPGDTAAYLLLGAPGGTAEKWIGRAGRKGVTLRLCWPAFQTVEDGQASEELDWLARHLLIFEIHSGLNSGDAERIAQAVRDLGSC